jgi:hypothetical protein
MFESIAAHVPKCFHRVSKCRYTSWTNLLHKASQLMFKSITAYVASLHKLDSNFCLKIVID